MALIHNIFDSFKGIKPHQININYDKDIFHLADAQILAHNFHIMFHAPKHLAQLDEDDYNYFLIAFCRQYSVLMEADVVSKIGKDFIKLHSNDKFVTFQPEKIMDNDQDRVYNVIGIVRAMEKSQFGDSRTIEKYPNVIANWDSKARAWITSFRDGKDNLSLKVIPRPLMGDNLFSLY